MGKRENELHLWFWKHFLIKSCVDMCHKPIVFFHPTIFFQTPCVCASWDQVVHSARGIYTTPQTYLWSFTKDARKKKHRHTTVCDRRMNLSADKTHLAHKTINFVALGSNMKGEHYSFVVSAKFHNKARRTISRHKICQKQLKMFSLWCE